MNKSIRKSKRNHIWGASWFSLRSAISFARSSYDL